MVLSRSEAIKSEVLFHETLREDEIQKYCSFPQLKINYLFANMMGDVKKPI